MCVFHNWRFDLETGACLHGDLPARRFAAELTDGVIVVRLGLMRPARFERATSASAGQRSIP